VIESARHELARLADVLERRREDGFVRQCHGDLHLRNIVLLDGQPTLFDGVEFNDAISCTDVLYDLAFLLMDLWRRRLPRHANVVWNRYLTDTEDVADLSLIPLFLSCRAAVRAKTSATAASLQREPERRAELYKTSREYLAMAEQLLRPPRASLIAVGGLSGSGKSTLARGLAPIVGAVPGAVVLRSDEIRKRLCGVGVLEQLGPEGYSPRVSERVYATLAERTVSILNNGHSAIVDAVYADPIHRQTIQRVATAASMPFIGLWLDAPEATLIGRAEQRRNDASDADASVIRIQRAQDIGDMTWHRLNASVSAESVLALATHHLRNNLRDGVNAAAM
jgi:predicted kinase